jgi:hypothetical protein
LATYRLAAGNSASEFGERYGAAGPTFRIGWHWSEMLDAGAARAR